MYVVTLCPTSRRTPRLLLAGDDDADNDDAGRRSRPSSRDMRSVREDFFLHVPNDSRNYTRPCVLVPRVRSQGSARRARAFTRGRVVRSHVQRREDGRARPRGGALDRSGIVLPHRDELPRVRATSSAAGASLLDSFVSRETRRREEKRAHHRSTKTSSLNRRRPHSSPSVRALARERNDGANERTRDRWNVDVSRLDAMTRRTVRIGSIDSFKKARDASTNERVE